MSESADCVETDKTMAGVDRLPEAVSAPSGRPADSMGDARVQQHCESLIRFGTFAGWSLGALGVVVATLHIVESPGGGGSSMQGLARVTLESATMVLPFVLLGWAVAAFARFTAVTIAAYFDLVMCVSNRQAEQAARGMALLERIATAFERPGQVIGPAPVPDPATPTLARARSMAEIVRATRAADWDEAALRLDEFETEFPDDPDLSTLKEELAHAREERARETIARLDAARAVNDADRVFEIYQELIPTLPEEERSSLERDLAKWFLSLIHRRLRTGRVQADVVQLAARFADTFGTTVEGASVRASLPTLRRSVGLCPRCAQPYIGVADACPACLKGATPSIVIHAPKTEQDGQE